MRVGLSAADWLPETFARPQKWMSDPKMNSEAEKKEEAAKREHLEVENSTNIGAN